MTFAAMPLFQMGGKKKKRKEKSFLFPVLLTNARQFPSLFCKWKWKFHLGVATPGNIKAEPPSLNPSLPGHNFHGLTSFYGSTYYIHRYVGVRVDGWESVLFGGW